MIDPTPILPAFDHVFDRWTTPLDVAQWERDSVALDHRPRVLVRDELHACLHGYEWGQRLLELIRTKPLLDWYLWCRGADAFPTSYLGVISIWLKRRQAYEGRPETVFHRWLIEWQAARLWPENVFLGAHVTSLAGARAQLHEAARQCLPPMGPATHLIVPPKLWLWWPDCREPGATLGLHPGFRKGRWNETKHATDQAWAGYRQRVLHWVLAGGEHAGSLARECAGFRKAFWSLDDPEFRFYPGKPQPPVCAGSDGGEGDDV